MVTKLLLPDGKAALQGALLFSLGVYLGGVFSKRRRNGPSSGSLHCLLRDAKQGGDGTVPYPPDAIPGGRDVETPYGMIRVYEWGLEAGEKVLLLHGVSAPVLTMSNLAQELVAKGYRVLTFDLFGRGYSDNPPDAHHDIRLYTTQILLALSSSSLPWLGANAFHLIGYSFGGCLAVPFTRYFPHLVKSLTLIASGGLIRETHTNWTHKVLYSDLLPEWLLLYLIRKRLTPDHPANIEANTEVVVLNTEKPVPSKNGGSDATGGDSYDGALISRLLPGTTIAQAIAWQVRHHPGFIPAFVSSMSHAPIYRQQKLWSELGTQLRLRSQRGTAAGGAICGGRVLFVLGTDDPVIVEREHREDATAVLGDDLVEFVTFYAGHEVVITKAKEIAGTLSEYWGRERLN